MSQSFDASRSLTALEQDNTIVAVIEMSKAKWLIAALVPGFKRQPLKKIDADAPSLLKLLQRWRNEAGQAGHTIKRIAGAYEAAGDGFWLARWLRARDIEAYAIHPASVAVSREHRRAKTDRLDTELDARLSRLVAWREAPLQYGGDSDARRRGRAATASANHRQGPRTGIEGDNEVMGTDEDRSPKPAA